MATIEERLKKIIKDQFGIEDDEFVPRARLYESFRADTMDLVEISWAIAEEFHLKFIDVDISRLLTIGDLLDFLKEHLLRWKFPDFGVSEKRNMRDEKQEGSPSRIVHQSRHHLQIGNVCFLE